MQPYAWPGAAHGGCIEAETFPKAFAKFGMRKEKWPDPGEYKIGEYEPYASHVRFLVCRWHNVEGRSF